jgi:LemA protein
MAHNYNAYPFGRWIKWAVIGLIILIIVISSISTYNSLIGAEQNVKRTWSQVENQMQRRADTITNIVESVKGYIKHEEKVFGDIAAARSVLISGSEDIQSKLAADEELKVAGRQILALVESYPELKASEQFSDLNVVIEGSENRVAVARKDFIYAVQEYNNKVKRFPGKIFAGMMGFEPMDYFEADETAKEAPKVKF